MLLVNVLAGPAFDAGFAKAIMWTGSFLVVFGLMMTSIARQYWQFVLAQGLAVGIGFGLLFLPSVAIIPQYFKEHRALANGIVASSAGVGTSTMGVFFLGSSVDSEYTFFRWNNFPHHILPT